MDASPEVPDETWTVCTKCDGEGKILKPPTRKARLRHHRARQEQAASGEGVSGAAAPPLLGRWEPCSSCDSRGIVTAATTTPSSFLAPSFERPRIAVIGGGLAGLALAAAARHRGLHCIVYERDEHFYQRRQGYGLTMQQASKALRRLGILELRGGITSTKHVVHQQDGKIVGEWGLRKWGRPHDKKQPKRQNVHIARQALRYQLWRAAGNDNIRWNHRLSSFVETKEGVDLSFTVGDKIVSSQADIVVGADGIRSQVRQQLVGASKTPLRYLGCIVVLGICPLEGLPESHLLDGETVFQTADGTTRIYMMPYSLTEYMWQLSFPMDEDKASALSGSGPGALREEAIKRCNLWHTPVAEILEATPIELVSGYPVYDRALLEATDLKASDRITLIGDACHPMSPFKGKLKRERGLLGVRGLFVVPSMFLVKLHSYHIFFNSLHLGQGANQAMLDALSLAGHIYKASARKEKEGENSIATVLEDFEAEMLERSAAKVEASAEAAKFLHTSVAIQEGNVTRGAASRACDTQS